MEFIQSKLFKWIIELRNKCLSVNIMEIVREAQKILLNEGFKAINGLFC